MAQKSTVQLGLDLGGSKILGVAVSGSNVLASAKRSTKVEEGYEAVVRRIGRVVHEVCDLADVRPSRLGRLGIGVPGPVAGNELLHAPNLGWSRPTLARDLAEETGIEHVVLGNDVNCGALGEATVGVAKGAASVFGLFVGTGLGGGWVQRGRVHEGVHGFAGEVGHLTVPGQDALCGCGQRGCLETIASKRGIVRLLREAIAEGKPCQLTDLEGLKSRQIEEAYRAGCPSTVGAIESAAQHLGWAINLISCLLDPDVIVLGGGVAERLGNDLLPGIARARAAATFVAAHTRADVRVGELGGNAVAIGAAQLGGK